MQVKTVRQVVAYLQCLSKPNVLTLWDLVGLERHYKLVILWRATAREI